MKKCSAGLAVSASCAVSSNFKMFAWVVSICAMRAKKAETSKVAPSALALVLVLLLGRLWPERPELEELQFPSSAGPLASIAERSRWWRGAKAAVGTALSSELVWVPGSAGLQRCAGALRSPMSLPETLAAVAASVVVNARCFALALLDGFLDVGACALWM